MLFRIANGNSVTESTYSDNAAANLIARLQPNFSKPLQKIPAEAEDKPKLKIVGGSRK